MTTDITILSLEDRESWVAEHRDGGLPSQSWHYAWGLSAGGIEPKLAVVRTRGARMLLPFVERHWNGCTDMATIQGISGASIMPARNGPLSLWREYAISQQWVSGYIQLAAATELGEADVAGRLVTNNMVLLLDIGDDLHVDALSRTVRRKIRAAATCGVALTEERSVLTDRLLDLYPATMQRVAAAREFLFTQQTLARWAADDRSVLLGAQTAGEVHAVYLFLTAGSHAESHILGYSDQGRELIAWLIWKGTQRLRDQGVKILNLTGGMRPGDGIYRFKQSFGAVPTPRRAVYQIYDNARYERLCRIAGVSSDANWFPAYRAGDGLTLRHSIERHQAS